MLGAETVMKALADRMDEALPDVLADMREKRGLDVFELPDPARTIPYQPDVVTLGEWPCIFTQHTMIDQLDQELTTPETGVLYETFQFRYTCRVYALLRSDSQTRVEQMGQRYEEALRVCVLQRKDITPTNIETGESIMINPVKVKTEPWDIMPDDSNRFITAVYVEVPVYTDEIVPSPFSNRGVAEVVGVETEATR